MFFFNVLHQQKHPLSKDASGKEGQQQTEQQDVVFIFTWQGVFPDTLVLDTSDQPEMLGNFLFYRTDAITAAEKCNCSRE